MESIIQVISVSGQRFDFSTFTRNETYFCRHFLKLIVSVYYFIRFAILYMFPLPLLSVSAKVSMLCALYVVNMAVTTCMHLMDPQLC